MDNGSLEETYPGSPHVSAYPLKEMMDSESLKHFYPMDLLGPEGLKALAAGISVQEFQDEDYVYRLGEELNDLLYVLEGTVQVMDIEKRTNEVISHADGRASKPFTHKVPAGAVAVAKPQSRILQVDYQLLLELLPQHPEATSAVRPCRKPEPAPVAPSPVASEPEYLELPDSVDKDIQLLKPADKPLTGKSRPEPETKQKTKQKTKPAESARKQAESPPTPEAVATTPPAGPPKARRKSVSDMLTDLKVVLNSDIRLEPRTLKPEVSKPAQAEPAAARPVSLYETTEAIPPPPKPKRRTMSELLSGAREILYSDIRLEPRHKPPSPAPGDEEDANRPVLLKLSDDEFREVETREYLRAMTLFRDEKWESAHAAFKALYAANPRTNLYRTYVNRCQERLSTPSSPC